MRLLSRIKKFLPLIGIALLFYTVYTLDLSKIIEAFLSIPIIFILLAIPLTLPRVLIRNSAWFLIQREQKINVSFWRSLKIFLIGYFYGSITPGYLGQLMRILYLKEDTGEPYGKLFVNSFIEATVHTFSLYLMILLGSLLVLDVFPMLPIVILSWIIFIILFTIYFIKKERGEKLFTLLSRGIPQKLKIHGYRFTSTFYKDFPRIRKLLLPLLLGLFTWLIIFTQEYLIVVALKLPIPYYYFILLFPVANAAGFIPISFAGLGAREFTAVMLFSTLFGIPGEKIFVVSLLGFIITDVLTGFIGFLCSIMDSNSKKQVFSS